ncbi:MAG: phosphatase PAP2 family protein [Anaerolineae bacterium]|nr:phosphatase PAP2 family protein [Anaerolineae bacterium]MDW8098386.1 phosphatase PAP2 family protein [Anaerolineae bacterium]
MKWSPLAQRIVAWDRVISQRWQKASTGWAYHLATAGAHLGDGWVWVLTLALTLALMPATARPLIWRWMISMAVAGGITTSIKLSWRRQRPMQRRGFYSQAYDQHSFPSGHATRMGTVMVYLPALFPGWGWLVLLLTLWVGWSRVALGVHYLLDVIAGLAVGFVVSLIVLHL